MSTHFITNQEKLLSDVVKNILPSSEKLYFLIGYFYFSGFQELYKHVDDKEIKILVGLDIEHDLANKIREYEIVQEVNIARGKIREVVRAYCNTPLRAYRQAAKRAVEIMGDRPGMSEDFSARPWSPEEEFPPYENPYQFAETFKECSVHEYMNVSYSSTTLTMKRSKKEE